MWWDLFLYQSDVEFLLKSDCLLIDKIVNPIFVKDFLSNYSLQMFEIVTLIPIDARLSI